MRKTLKTLFMTLACALLLIGGLGALGAFTADPVQANPTTVQAEAPAAPAQSAEAAVAKKPVPEISVVGAVTSIAKSTGVAGFMAKDGWKSLFMIGIGFLLLYLGVVKDESVIIIDSMKMELEVKTKVAGVITYKVGTGESAAAGQVLAIVC